MRHVFVFAALGLGGCYEMGHHAYDHHVEDEHHLLDEHDEHVLAEHDAIPHLDGWLPAKPVAAVSLLVAPPPCPFVVIGAVPITDWDLTWPQQQLELRRAAASMGADAVVLVHDDHDDGNHAIVGHEYSANAIAFTGLSACTTP